MSPFIILEESAMVGLFADRFNGTRVAQSAIINIGIAKVLFVLEFKNCKVNRISYDIHRLIR